MLTPEGSLRIAAVRLAAASMVFAVVEQQQHALLFEAGAEAGKLIVRADFKADVCRNHAQVADAGRPEASGRRQTVFMALLGDSERNRRLADPSRPDDRHQPLARQSRDQSRHGFIPADHPGCRERQLCSAGVAIVGDGEAATAPLWCGRDGVTSSDNQW